MVLAERATTTLFKAHDGNVVFMTLLHFHSSCLLFQSLIVRNAFTNTKYSLHPPTSLLGIGFIPSIPPIVDQKAFLCNILEHTQITSMGRPPRSPSAGHV